MEGEVVSKTLIIARVDKKEKRVWKVKLSPKH